MNIYNNEMNRLSSVIKNVLSLNCQMSSGPGLFDEGTEAQLEYANLSSVNMYMLHECLYHDYTNHRKQFFCTPSM